MGKSDYFLVFWMAPLFLKVLSNNKHPTPPLAAQKKSKNKILHKAVTYKPQFI